MVLDPGHRGGISVISGGDKFSQALFTSLSQTFCLLGFYAHLETFPCEGLVMIFFCIMGFQNLLLLLTFSLYSLVKNT